MGRYHNLNGNESMQEALLEALVDNVRDVFLGNQNSKLFNLNRNIPFRIIQLTMLWHVPL